jgi:hypothetical protein
VAPLMPGPDDAPPPPLLAGVLRTDVPEVLFIGAITPVSTILKMSWSAGFVAAAFAGDALKTAADRGTLGLEGHRSDSAAHAASVASAQPHIPGG